MVATKQPEMKTVLVVSMDQVMDAITDAVNRFKSTPPPGVDPLNRMQRAYADLLTSEIKLAILAVPHLFMQQEADAPDDAPTPPFAGSWDKPEWPAEVILEREG